MNKRAQQTTLIQPIKIAEPFIKWAGGKRSLLPEIIPKIPKEINEYFEPFIGGGAVFFALAEQIKKATISDTNSELILAYKVIQKDPQQLIASLKAHAENHAKHPKEYYYKIREMELEDPIEIASRFIYLNKTCYNGLYRVNKSGKFNVPLGSYTNPNIVSEENIMLCHEALQKATILIGDFEIIKPQRNDFVYLDPPYHPTTETSFTKYTKENFTEKDQERLRDFILKLTKIGVKIMLSNSNTKFIKELYESKKFNHFVVMAPRLVNCKPLERNAVEELLITNY